MRIILVHQFFLDKDDAGGSRWNEMARFWAQRGHHVTVLAGTVHYATGRKNPEYKGKFIVTEQISPGVVAKRCHVSESYNRSFLGRFWAYLSFAFSSTIAGLQSGPADVLVCTSPPLTVGLTGVLLKTLKRTPMVFEVRDLWPDFAIETGVLTNPLLIRLSLWLEKLSYAGANWINVLTPAFRAKLVSDKNIDPRRISTITNAADLDIFQPADKDNWVRGKHGLEGKFVVTYVGAHGVANHLIQILEAARLLREEPDIHFLLVGDGMEKPMLKDKAVEWNLNNVTFIDSVPKRTIVDYVAASDVCTAVLKGIESFKTVYPNKVFDYMSAERPIILGIDGVARELIEKAGAGIFVTPERPEEFADAVRKLYEDKDLCRRLGRSGLDFVRENFSRKKLAARYLQILEEQVVPARYGRAVLPDK